MVGALKSLDKFLMHELDVPLGLILGALCENNIPWF